jgi:hypothetical protein
MQNNNNKPNRSYTPSKDYISPNAPEPELRPTYLSGLFKPPSDPKEAEIERAKLHGRQSQNDNKFGSFKG